ncbi:MAG: serine/threonine protein kinase [Mycobacteriaceae bacterium]|nr:serine/threonine protein kinase [Mycobacteriaceae bacterium]
MMASDLLGGRYELRGVLGRGGMAEVRDGWDTRLSRAVAVKLLHPGFAHHVESRERFDAEARSAASLNNSHIVAVHDTGEHNGTPFIVMERLPGASLADYIARGPLPQPLVRSVLDDVLAALAAAHEAGILHRDIKPGNILFTSDGEAKVSDFGIAKTADAGYTTTGQVVGTMAYLSPERLLGNPATPADDLYALGVVGYEALTGRRPFMGENFGALVHAILSEQPAPLEVLRPDVDPALTAVVERAMARNPAWRFQNARAMRAALLGVPVATMPSVAAAVGGRPPTRVLDEPVPPLPTYAPVGYGLMAGPSASRRNRKLLGVGAVVAAFLLAAVLVVFDSPFQSSPAPKSVTTSTPVPIPTTTLPTTASTTSGAPVEEEPPPARRPGRPHRGHGD